MPNNIAPLVLSNEKSVVMLCRLLGGRICNSAHDENSGRGPAHLVVPPPKQTIIVVRCNELCASVLCIMVEITVAQKKTQTFRKTRSGHKRAMRFRFAPFARAKHALGVASVQLFRFVSAQNEGGNAAVRSIG